MEEALGEAEEALNRGEVPIGAVIVKDNRIVGRGHNEIEGRGVATAHAEMLAIQQAAGELGDWRLNGCTLYVTLQPCQMCLGAICLSRVSRIVFGAKQSDDVACGSIGNFPDSGLFNYKIKVTGGIKEEKSLLILKEFFSNLRKEEKKRRDARAG
ncbi:nucleoside deaminase [bacterium]|nr:nucleoside deaminase [bacterium]